MARAVKIGDVVEILTTRGLAYAQCTHRHTQPPRYGYLIRILPGFHAVRPTSFDALVKQRDLFRVFYPLGSAISRGLVVWAARELVPDSVISFPTFRCGVPASDGRVQTWWLWDGSREWPVASLTPAQRSLPIREVINHNLLLERIESEYKVEHNV